MNEQEMFDAYADMMDTVFEVGRSAGRRGCSIDDCPYEDRRLKNQWTLGFRKARETPTP